MKTFEQISIVISRTGKLDNWQSLHFTHDKQLSAYAVVPHGGVPSWPTWMWSFVGTYRGYNYNNIFWMVFGIYIYLFVCICIQTPCALICVTRADLKVLQRCFIFHNKKILIFQVPGKGEQSAEGEVGKENLQNLIDS